MRHSPHRMCVACRARRPQAELLRFARRRDGEIVPAIANAIGAGARPPGRTAYVCPTHACVHRAVVRRGLSRALGSTGLVVRPITEEHSLITATEHALDRRIETLSRSGAAASTRLPQLQLLRQSLQQGRSA